MKRLDSLASLLYLVFSIVALYLLWLLADISTVVLAGFSLVLLFLFIETWRIRRQNAKYAKNTKDTLLAMEKRQNLLAKEMLTCLDDNSKRLIDHESSRARGSQKILSEVRLNSRRLADHEGARVRAAEKSRVSAEHMLRRLSDQIDEISSQIATHTGKFSDRFGNHISKVQESLNDLDGILRGGLDIELEGLKTNTELLRKQLSDHEGARARASKRESDLISQIIIEAKEINKSVKSFDDSDIKNKILSGVEGLISYTENKLLTEMDDLLFEIILLRRHLDGETEITLPDVLNISSISSVKRQK
ncbi:hypothetical protein [Glutamicibacter sp.]|uniref:hypothetical protein n=1 Tax=Glutamicibacter sp. TaxID=1931995 RepID=UPI002B49B595|nr:hypothetical protein [Glutamicibacter sp.]HJX80234.1 hypothetical protein [Glutamicibacter sp.]